MSLSELFSLKGQKQAERAKACGEQQEPAALTAPEDLQGGTHSPEDTASSPRSANAETSKREKSPVPKERLIPRLLAPTVKPLVAKSPDRGGFFENIGSGGSSGGGVGSGIGLTSVGGVGGGDCGGGGGGDCGC